MPFRRRFDCLWCGREWQVRGEDDLEGWTGLCPECLGKADDNGFLRARLRAGLRERASAAAPPAATPSAAAPPAPPAPALPPPPATASPAPDATHDDWYLRRGPFSRGPLHDGPWSMELDEVTRWLDSQPLRGTIVELAAGTGWWSALLAEKGELWLYDADGAALDAARRRLVAHGLRAHIHQRDPSAPADRLVDAVVAACFLGVAADDRGLAARLAVVRGWLEPDGSFVFIEAAPGATAPLPGPAGPLWPRSAEALTAALVGAGFEPVEIRATHSAFVTGRATRSP